MDAVLVRTAPRGSQAQAQAQAMHAEFFCLRPPPARAQQPNVPECTFTVLIPSARCNFSSIMVLSQIRCSPGSVEHSVRALTVWLK